MAVHPCTARRARPRTECWDRNYLVRYLARYLFARIYAPPY
jgi:hypothetical protein